MTVESLMLASDRAARRRFSVTLALFVLVVLLALISLGIGPVRLSPLTVLDALFDHRQLVFVQPAWLMVRIGRRRSRDANVAVRDPHLLALTQRLDDLRPLICGELRHPGRQNSCTSRGQHAHGRISAV